MISVLLPALYFIAFFGFFEVFMFRRGIAYWQNPIITAFYFLAGTVIALAIFNAEPLQMVLGSSLIEMIAVFALYAVLGIFAYKKWFTAGGESISSNVSPRAASFSYVFAKSADILFQDTLAVIVLLALYAYLGDITQTLIIFSVYFLVAHIALLLVLPPKFALIFVLGSALAAPVFAAIVLFDFGILYVFVLHWTFYTVMYSVIKNVRKVAHQMNP